MDTNVKNYSYEDVEWKSLERFGVTREMFNDLPWDMQAPILKGGISPCIVLTAPAAEGEEPRRFSARIYLDQPDPEDPKLRIMFLPSLSKSPELQIPEAERKLLDEGWAVCVADDEGNKIIYQIDPLTKWPIQVSQTEIEYNLNVLRSEMGFCEEEVSSLLSGKIVELRTASDEPISVGLDLFSPECVRIEDCERDEWRQRERRGSRYNFGLDGCWVEGDDGALSYVPEDKYDEEMLAEFNNPSVSGHRR